MFFDKRFFRNIPCKRKSREKTKTVAFGKVFTSIIAKIKINKITIIPIVSYTSGQILITFVNTSLQIFS